MDLQDICAHQIDENCATGVFNESKGGVSEHGRKNDGIFNDRDNCSCCSISCGEVRFQDRRACLSINPTRVNQQIGEKLEWA